MATVKTTTVVQNNITLTAGAGDTTSSSVNLEDGYGGSLYVKITNGATGPTNPAQVQIQTSPDDTNFFDLGGPLQGDSDNNGVQSWAIPIPIGDEFIRFVSGSNTGQNVTLRTEVTEVVQVDA